MKSNQPLLLVTLVVTLLISACSSPTPTPPKPEPKQTTITVSPESLSLIVGKSEQLSVVVSPKEVAVK